MFESQPRIQQSQYLTLFPKQQAKPVVPISHRAPDTICSIQRGLGNKYLQASGMYRDLRKAPMDRQGCGTGSCRNCALRHVQAKLTISQPNDVYEQEADRVAEQVMRIPDSSGLVANAMPGAEVDIQRLSPTGSVTPESRSDIQIGESGGQPLSSSTRQFMEPRFGVDFDHVRLHSDEHAHRTASQIQARAFTYGHHIWLGKGESEQDRNLMAHELTHVIQQNASANTKTIQKQTSGTASSGATTDPCQYSNCNGKHNGIQADLQRAIDYAIAAAGVLIQSPLSANTIQALDWYFNDHSQETADTVAQRLRCIALCLIDTYGYNQYGCDPDDPAIAYVRVGSTPVCEDAVTNICLTNIYFSRSDRVRAEALIHECGHRIGLSLGGPDFDIYDFKEHFLRLSTAEALMNTDSYALFAGAITNGIRVTVLANQLFPFGFGLSGGLALSGGTQTWYARFNYANVEFQHPSLRLFNPNLGIALTLIGESESQTEPAVHASTSFLASLTAGFRVSDPRPGPTGGTYFSFWGGPSLSISGPSTNVGLGAEAGVALGYRWRWLDVSVGGIYFHDPNRPEGLRDILTLGPSLSISFLPIFSSVPGSH